jgi:AcrR family transcriptional regulator
MSNENKRVTTGQETRLRIIGAARALFARGYEAVSTPEIADASSVTRGALYHHFADKKALFDAVVCEVAAAIVVEIDTAAAMHAGEPLDALHAGSIAFIDACQMPEVRQIFLVDGPSVLGWARWRAIDGAFGLGSLKAGLTALNSIQSVPFEHLETLAHLLSGALNEAALYVSDNGRTSQEIAQMKADVVQLIRKGLA